MYADVIIVEDDKQHIEYPRDRNLILFLDVDDTIKGYMEIEGLLELAGPTSTVVDHDPVAGTFIIEMGVSVLGGKNPIFRFRIRIEDSPF